MKEINNKEKQMVTGGAVNWGLAALIGAGASFLFGLFDGIFNPSKCKV